MADWSQYKGTLPYASELFGMYQPLIGWRSKRTKGRFDGAKNHAFAGIADKLLTTVRPKVSIDIHVNAAAREHTAERLLDHIKLPALRPLRVAGGPQPFVSPKIDTVVARLLSMKIGAKPPEDWGHVVRFEAMENLLQEAKEVVLDREKLAELPEIDAYVSQQLAAFKGDPQTALQSMFERESTISGFLAFLGQNHPGTLTSMFFKDSLTALLGTMQLQDPLLTFGRNAYDAVLSPIGVVHLYRQYFFEFDSFLGPSTGHIWLSPGGTVELIEVNTRKVYTERTMESLTETVQKSETEVTRQDELADAVKDENRSNIKFGFTNVATYSSPVFQDTATASFSLDNEKKSTRETTHKYMRQQSEKLSSEIKRSFKTTFKTSTEVTDTSSKRYVLQNKTNKLVNYELRRKMRKVGVQVQDIGVQLCWQTFVDDAGRTLGVGRLVHMAEPPELGDLQQPDAVPMPGVLTEQININIPFVGLDTDDTDNAYTDGSETEVGFLDSTEHIQPSFRQKATFKQANYTLRDVSLDPQGADAKLSVRDKQSADGSSSGEFTVHLDYVHWHDQSSINIAATLVWEPSQALKDSVDAENKKRVSLYSAEKARRTREAFYKAARERIKLASRIEPRKAEDLREEERTVVYRTLVKQLMSVAPDQSRHVVSELIRSIFDVDKMLYFVAPEWWQPRRHPSGQVLGDAEGDDNGAQRAGAASNAFSSAFLPGKRFIPHLTMTPNVKHATVLPANNLVDWGGGREKGRDNYYITEESAPAKLGSSLGWLLQLDGDDLRNAFLNSPWVKAVIPIRSGKEKAAINWLQQANVEGSDGLNANYVAEPDDPDELKSTPDHQVTISEALDHLIKRIGEAQQKARTPVMPNPMDPADPRNHFAGSVPAEAVFEHGFYPLKGGVHFDQDGAEQAIFSQWMEILPTDQIVALQVEYDPKTLQIKVTDGVASAGTDTDADTGEHDHDHDHDA